MHDGVTLRPYQEPVWRGPTGVIDEEAGEYWFYPHSVASKAEGPYPTLDAAVKHAHRRPVPYIWHQSATDAWEHPRLGTIRLENDGWWLRRFKGTEPQGPFTSVLAAMLVSEEA